ncbi:uDP-N-acetylmuramyl-tripeptide synthetase [Clostridium sp. CAG:798]|jgi:hypothetical protein|nr:uDP-N-acetylmuramyl-tripeptide synthetase [Clostridium sp. CAG:798]HBJ12692.1 hypothetical protein [Clostridiales bacterium]
MFFIGIVSEEKNEKHIKDILKQKIENENVVFINEKNIENIKNIKFKIIVLNKGIDNKNIKNILLNAEYLILNSDINVKIDLIENLDLKVITYGFNSKSTVTASSVTEEEMLICVQRNIINIKGKKIEPQEINIEKDIMLDNYDNMYIMCLAIIYGKM